MIIPTSDFTHKRYTSSFLYFIHKRYNSNQIPNQFFINKLILQTYRARSSDVYLGLTYSKSNYENSLIFNIFLFISLHENDVNMYLHLFFYTIIAFLIT